jgi:D-lactate dehydrogenase (cytochrome)
MELSGIKSTIVGHVGDGGVHVCTGLRLVLTISQGNFHALMLFCNNDELQAVTEAVHRLVHRAIALEGTCERLRDHFQ